MLVVLQPGRVFGQEPAQDLAGDALRRRRRADADFRMSRRHEAERVRWVASGDGEPASIVAVRRDGDKEPLAVGTDDAVAMIPIFAVAIRSLGVVFTAECRSD